MSRKRRTWLWWLLVVAFVIVPLVEIFTLIQVGQVIGPWWTIVLLILDSLVGGWLVKREGSRAWRALRTALSSGSMPGKELADGALILIGGTLMLTPGFVSDLVGIVLILPLTRPLFRRLLAGVVTRKLLAGGIVQGVPGRSGAAGASWATKTPRPGPGSGDGSVVQGEVVDDQG